MIVVACAINGVECEVLIDTGAQSSVLTTPLLRQLGLTGALDRRVQGVAAGVGTAAIIGHCHDVTLEMGHVEFLCDFAVLDTPNSLAILGLDAMRLFKCVVDLEREVLVFGGSGGVEVPFLPPERAHEWSRFARGGGSGADLAGCTLQ